MQELRLAVGDRVMFWDLGDFEPSARLPEWLRRGSLCRDWTSCSAKLAPNHGMWFCDGRLRFVVEEVTSSFVVARMVEGTAPLKSSNSLFLPD